MLTPITETSNGSDENATSQEFPFMVSLIVLTEEINRKLILEIRLQVQIYDDNGAFSNGILISENFVLAIANNG